MILKHNAHEKVLKVDQEDDGINFYYKNSTHAQRLIDFLGSLLPITVKNSKQLISHDESSNIFVYKYGFSVEIPRICRDDLVLIPKKLATVLGGCSQLLLCLKVSTMMTLLDLGNFRVLHMNSQQYEHYDKDIQLLALSTYRSQFAVLDC
jgi:nonsense-mediated mRNA decay protein 3